MLDEDDIVTVIRKKLKRAMHYLSQPTLAAEFSGFLTA